MLRRSGEWAILMFLMAAATQPAPLQAADKPTTAQDVHVAPAISREVNILQAFVGTVMPLKASTVGSAVDGRVLKFLVNEGDAVKAGDELAKLRTATLEIELKVAEAELQLREHELEELENGSRPEEIEQAKARLLAAQAMREYRQSNHQRIASLFKQSRTVTDDQYRESLAAKEQAEQAYIAAKADLSLVTQGPRPERIAQAKAQVLIQQERVNLIQERIDRHTVVAPFDGYVTAEHTEVGEWIQEGDPVVEVIKIDKVDIRAGVLSKHAVNLKLGEEVPVVFPELPERKNLTGQIVHIIPQADKLSRSIPVNVRMTNPLQDGTPLFKAGMLAHIRLPTTGKRRALLVPKDALVLVKDEPSHLLVVQTSSEGPTQFTVRRVDVTTGVSLGKWIEVSGDIAVDELVVLEGNERLRPGETINILETIEPPPADAD